MIQPPCLCTTAAHLNLQKIIEKIIIFIFFCRRDKNLIIATMDGSMFSFNTKASSSHRLKRFCQKRPVYIFAFGEFNSQQVKVSCIQHFLAQLQGLELRKKNLNAANHTVWELNSPNLNIQTLDSRSFNQFKSKYLFGWLLILGCFIRKMFYILNSCLQVLE